MLFHDRLQQEPEPLAGSLLDCAETGLVAFRPDGLVLIANTAAHSLLGFPHRTSAALRLDDAAGLVGSEKARLLALVADDVAPPLRLVTASGLTLAVTRRSAACGSSLLSFIPVYASSPVLSRTDPLTGLADRRSVTERLAALCSTGTGLGLMVIALQRPEHAAGTPGPAGPAGNDPIPRLVADRLRRTCRSTDIVGYLGNDEFAVILPGGTELAEVAQRILRVINRPYLTGSRSTVVTADIGLALAPAEGADSTALFRAADLALHAARREGPGIVRVFDTALDDRARARAALADDLRAAIPAQQLRLYFRPQLCLASGELAGFEALIRWPHPQHGLVPSDEFLPLAEEIGLDVPLGEWILFEACRQATRWPPHLSVAVNVSPKQLGEHDRLPRMVANALASTGLPAHRLEIEITEGALVREGEALAVLTAIRALGVRVSMDEFGTGYASLSQLRRFPFDKLKVDRSFIAELGDGDEAACVVRAIAALGRSLGLATAAEGVETADHEPVFHGDGCAVVMGGADPRPVSAEDVAVLIERINRSPPGSRV